MFKKEKLENIQNKNFEKIISVKNDKIKFRLNGVKTGILSGKETIADEFILNNIMENISAVLYKNETNYINIPDEVIINFDKEKTSEKVDTNESDNKKEVENRNIIEIIEPKYTLDSVYLNPESKKQIMNTIEIKKHRDKIFNEWGLEETIKSDRAIILNFYGPAGTGKSLTAEAIAGTLGKKLYSVNYSELESKYVGETPKNIKQVFKRAKDEDAVLVMDEADSFLSKRLSNITQSADYGVNITRSVMLLELEKFDGIVIFTTNLLENYDEAFKRRILSNIKFELPDKKGRKKIWDIHIPSKLPLEKEIDSEFLAEKYDDISGADIKDMLLFAAINAASASENIVGVDEFDKAYEYIKARYNTTTKEDNGFKIISKKSEKITVDEYNKIINNEENKN
ncbi:ATP-binding protein [Peptacetobacter hiranonis]|uniref:ATP-binding protein n=1 Tax=Peptacetobacter hiranonis TaxID=89152 RepID=UPI002E7904C9|nr:ATP-binding protein [Peptacetobacter hiranonis]MEE0248410.1 ATP-binding protein [Peptacetobacter hiranonis]